MLKEEVRCLVWVSLDILRSKKISTIYSLCSWAHLDERFFPNLTIAFQLPKERLSSLSNSSPFFLSTPFLCSLHACIPIQANVTFPNFFSFNFSICFSNFRYLFLLYTDIFVLFGFKSLLLMLQSGICLRAFWDL